jgi:hypothetical protein
MEVLREPIRHAPELGVKLCPVGQVALEGVLDADRDPLGLTLETAGILAAGAILQDTADASGQHAAELLPAQPGEVADRPDTRGHEARFRLWPDTR